MFLNDDCRYIMNIKCADNVLFLLPVIGGGSALSEIINVEQKTVRIKQKLEKKIS